MWDGDLGRHAMIGASLHDGGTGDIHGRRGGHQT
jgi:hypothetical protein